MSVQYLVNCAVEAGSCYGGGDLAAFQFMHREGVADTTCLAYIGRNVPCTPEGRCENCKLADLGQCSAQLTYEKYFVDEFGWIPGGQANTIHRMKAEIYARGPISCTADFNALEDYKGGIVTKPGVATNHFISIAGWGVADDGTEYWIARNSWGTYWGDQGWFYAKIGVNPARMEASCTWATPAWPPILQVEPATNGYDKAEQEDSSTSVMSHLLHKHYRLHNKTLDF